MVTHSLFPEPIKVVVNALHAKSGGGVTYLRNIIGELARDKRLDLHVFLHRDQAGLLPAGIDGVTVRVLSFKTGFLRLLVWEQTVLPLLLWRMGADVTFSPANFGPLLAPAPVILLRNSLAVLGREPRFSRRIYWYVLAFMTWASLLLARRAIAVSDYARRTLCSPARGAKVTVVHHGVSRLFTPEGEREAAMGPYLLAVSDLYVQKNLHHLVEAMAIVVQHYPTLRLLVAGREIDADYAGALCANVQRLGLADAVQFLGHVPAEQLGSLYRGAEAFVFPSTVETFGNPLLEAMASGAAIASSNTAAMPEVLGDAGLYFNPFDVADMARVVLSLLGDESLRRSLRQRARERAARFSWAETGRRTAEVLVDAAGRPSDGSL